MITITSKYLGDLRCESVHTPSAKALTTDAPLDNNGKGETFSPTDLLATATLNCMITIMGIKANQSNIDISGTTGKIDKVMASEPRRIGELNIKINVPNKNLTDKEKTILERAAMHCPVMESIAESIKKNVEVTFNV
jgi:putative redox protein